MKKVLFLTMMVMMMGCQRSCEGDVLGGFPFPPGKDWALDIVKFKNPEYKNYILTRKSQGEEMDSKGRLYADTSYYRLNDPVTIDEWGAWKETLSSDLLQKGQWIDLGNGYLLCYWRWSTIFSCGYGVYNICERKEEIDNVLLMQDEWTDLPDTMTYTLYEGKEQVAKIIDLFYYTTDSSRIMDEFPIAEHYVVTAKSLYAFTGSPCDKTSKMFLEYNPLNDNTAGLAWKLNEKYQVQQGDMWVVRDFFPKTYDSLFNKISDMARTVVQSGKLQEYIAYDLKYNHVEEKKADISTQINCDWYDGQWHKYK